MVPHRKKIGALAFAIALVWVCAVCAVAEEDSAPAGEGDSAPAAEEGGAPTAEAPPKSAGPAPMSYWLLEEFDWGDDEEVVAESVQFDPYYECKGTGLRPCVLVSTVVDRERLLARFHHHQGELWQIAILTPDLDRAQAAKHLARVQNLLVDYVTRMRGEPKQSHAMPELGSLEIGPPQLTDFWSLPDLEVRILVGRRDSERFYVGAWFSDPVRGAVAREAYEARVASSDERLRSKRGSKTSPSEKQAPDPDPEE